jgi:hypothetical protein
MQVRYHHVHVRWSKAYNYHFGREGSEDKMAMFLAEQDNDKLIITEQEYQMMLMIAEEHGSPRTHFQGPHSVPIQMNKKGVLSVDKKRKETQCEQPAGSESLYNSGSLRQSVCIPKAKKAKIEATAVMVTPVRAGKPMDIEDRLANEVKDIVGLIHNNPAAVEQLFSVLSTYKKALVAGDDPAPLDLSKMVSFPATEKRRRYKRLTARGEPDRKMIKELQEPAVTRILLRESCLNLDFLE